MRKEYDIEKLNPKENPYVNKVKKPITINLNTEVIEYFKKLAKKNGLPYQTLINLYLMDCVENRRELAMSWE